MSTADSEVFTAALTRGNAALEAGHFADAARAFGVAAATAPGDHTLALLLANAHQLAGDALAARETLLRVHRQRPPADPAVSYALGAALLEAGAPREAAACFLRVSRARPSDPAPVAALAGAKRSAGDPAAAWSFIEEALRLEPDSPAFLLTAAQIRHELADLDGAEQWIARAVAVRPDHGPTLVQRAYTSLLRGTSHAGWTDFEARALPVPESGARAWHGESLDGTSILVTAEQGVGDQFQFVRFVHRLRAYNPSRVIVQCHVDAVALFVASGFDAVPRGTSPHTDWHVPMMSLPFRLRLDTVVDADRVPYLHAPAQLGASQLGVSPLGASTVPPRRHASRQLGLVWAGNPAFTGRITRDLDRARLPELLSIPDVEWVALQHGEADAFPSPIEDTVLQRPPLSTDWSVTAQWLTQLDGLVTTDTGIAHLAGAMGIRTYVLLQYVPDWRWGLHGTHSTWYPSHTLLRQPTSGDWASVIDALRAALAAAT